MRVYDFEADVDTVTASQDIFEIQPATDKPVKLLWFLISQVTETGDSEEEQLELTLVRRTGTPTSGSGGTTVTAYPVDQAGAADAATVEENNTTKASAGTAEIHGRIGWNVRVPLLVLPPPEGWPTITANDLMHLELISTPADSIDIVVMGQFGELA